MTDYILSGFELLTWRSKLLSLGGKEVDLNWLLDFGGGIKWSRLKQISINPEQKIVIERSLEDLENLWIIHLGETKPLQYLIGRCQWRDFELEINPSAMIPRNESELLIDFAIAKFNSTSPTNWVDLGSGSGALSIALAKAYPCSQGHAVDKCENALALTRRNLISIFPDANVIFHLGEWWEPLRPWWGTLDLVLANPPYIPEEVIKQLDPIVRDNEPNLALSGGIDGLDAFREIIKGAQQAMSKNAWLILEHHFDQSDQVLSLMTQYGFEGVKYENDLQGIRRFAIGRTPEKDPCHL